MRAANYTRRRERGGDYEAEGVKPKVSGCQDDVNGAGACEPKKVERPGPHLRSRAPAERITVEQRTSLVIIERVGAGQLIGFEIAY